MEFSIRHRGQGTGGSSKLKIATLPAMITMSKVFSLGSPDTNYLRYLSHAAAKTTRQCSRVWEGRLYSPKAQACLKVNYATLTCSSAAACPMSLKLDSRVLGLNFLLAWSVQHLGRR